MIEKENGTTRKEIEKELILEWTEPVKSFYCNLQNLEPYFNL